MAFSNVIFDPVLPPDLAQLRGLLAKALTTSVSPEASADAIGFYCTVTELRSLVTTYLEAEPTDFGVSNRRDASTAFAVLGSYRRLFDNALRDLRALGVASVITDMLEEHFDSIGPVEGLASASITVFLGCRLAS